MALQSVYDQMQLAQAIRNQNKQRQQQGGPNGIGGGTVGEGGGFRTNSGMTNQMAANPSQMQLSPGTANNIVKGLQKYGILGGGAAAPSFSAAGAAPAIQSGVGSTIGAMAPNYGAGALGSASSMGFGGGAAGGAGAGAAGGGMAAAGPFAALAALIMLNEADSKKRGLRSENQGEYTKDLLTGKVLTQDIEGKWGPLADKLTGGFTSKSGLTGDAKGASQLMSGRIGPGLKTFTKEGTPGKFLKALKKLF